MQGHFHRHKLIPALLQGHPSLEIYQGKRGDIAHFIVLSHGRESVMLQYYAKKKLEKGALPKRGRLSAFYSELTSVVFEVL